MIVTGFSTSGCNACSSDWQDKGGYLAVVPDQFNGGGCPAWTMDTMFYGFFNVGFSPPRWWDDFVLRAKDELRARPTSDVVFSMAFLAQSAQAGCERCGGSILAAHAFLEELKKNIDALPSTI